MAPEIAATHNGVCEPASRKKPTLSSCVGGGHRVPHHRTSRGEARRHQQDRRHAHGDPDCPVRFGTHDGRVAHSAHLRKLHSVRFGTHDGRVAHSAHLQKLHSVRFGTHDGRVAHSAHLRKLHSASRHPCSSICHHLWCTSCDDSAPSAVSCAVRPAVAPTVTYVGEAAPVAPASAIKYGAAPAMTYLAPPAVTYVAPPPVAPDMTYMGKAPMVESAPAVTYPAVIYGAPAGTYFRPPPVAPL